MVIGAGFIEGELEQQNVLILACFSFFSVTLLLVDFIAFFVLSPLVRRHDFHVFLSHAIGSGGAVARPFKLCLLRGRAQRHARIQMFIASDNLVSLLELTVYVQRTRTWC